MSMKIASKKRDENFEKQEGLSLNDCALRGRGAAMNYRRPNEVHYSYQAPTLAA